MSDLTLNFEFPAPLNLNFEFNALGAISYTLPIATASILGGVKEGSGVTIGIDGTISAAGTYTLPIASGSTLGGIKVGTRLSIDGAGILSADIQTQDLSGYLLINSFTDASVTGKLITGFSSGAGTVEATDTILQALNKLNGNIAAKEVPLTFGSGVTRTVNAVANDLITGKSGGQTILGSTLATENLILSSTSHATIGSVNVGTIAKGENLNIQATEGAELAPALTGNSGVNWTLSNTNGYTQPFAGTIDKTGNGTGTITTTAATTIVAGTTYKVVIVVSAISGSTATWTIGGSTGKTLIEATTYTDYIRATTTGKIIITPVATALRITITSISIKEITNGNLNVYGKFRIPTELVAGDTLSDYLTYKSTTGTGTLTGAAHKFKGGTNGATVIATLFNNGQIGIGTESITTQYDIDIAKATIFSTSTVRVNERFYVGGNASYNSWGVERFNFGYYYRQYGWIQAAGLSTGIPILLNPVGGNIGIGLTTAADASARLTLPAGTATAGTAPLKLTSGPLLATPEAGAIEFLTDGFYGTITTSAVRRMFVLSQTGRATAQTAANASVHTFTLPATDGSYQIAANVLVTTSSAEAFTVTCAYTDEGNTARTATLNFQLIAGTIGTNIAFANGAVPYMGIPFNIRCKASTAITIATTGTFTGCTYNVEAFFKKLA